MPDIMPAVYTKLYVVFDTIAKDLFGAIIRAPNDEVARRAFHDLLSQKESPISAHKGDYNLLFLGAIDNLGNITANDKADVLARGQDWLDANKES